VSIEPVGHPDLDDLLPMLRAYCAFYERAPDDDALLELARSLIARPDEGVQLIARSEAGEPLGFATVYWTWQTTTASRLGVMNDLFVVLEHRGHGVGEALIEACRRLAREHGAARLAWQTAPDNRTAQRLYERVGATREQWIDYWLDA
jgi:GNAT superfamily N-acetyltransferase